MQLSLVQKESKEGCLKNLTEDEELVYKIRNILHKISELGSRKEARSM
jgi:hypothetical protein